MAPPDSMIPAQTVQWYVRSFAVAANFDAVYAPIECPKRAPFERRLINFIARRSMLRWLIGAYLRCEPESLHFGVTELGKPALNSPRGARLAFNVSHTDGIALLAFALNCRLGIDVERRFGDIDVVNVARGIFSPIEESRLAAARADSTTAFFSIWTRKEALLKALGEGLGAEPTAYTTADSHAPSEGRWHASKNGTPVSGWTCLDLGLGTEVHGAVAVSLYDARVRIFHCSPITRPDDRPLHRTI